MSSTDEMEGKRRVVTIPDDRRPSYGIVNAVADMRGKDVTDIGPVLHESGVDGEHLDNLLAGDGEVAVRLTVAEFRFEVTAESVVCLGRSQ